MYYQHSISTGFVHGDGNCHMAMAMPKREYKYMGLRMHGRGALTRAYPSNDNCTCRNLYQGRFEVSAGPASAADSVLLSSGPSGVRALCPHCFEPCCCCASRLLARSAWLSGSSMLPAHSKRHNCGTSYGNGLRPGWGNTIYTLHHAMCLYMMPAAAKCVQHEDSRCHPG